MVEASSSRHPVLVLFILQPFSLSHYELYFFLTLHCQLHLSMDKRQKNMRQLDARHDMFCHQTFEVWRPLKQTVAPIRLKLFLYFWAACYSHLLLFSTFRNISHSETAHLPLKIILCSIQLQKFFSASKNSCHWWILCWTKTNQVDKQLSTLP